MVKLGLVNSLNSTVIKLYHNAKNDTGKVVKSGRQVFLKMYKAYYYKGRWRMIDDAVDNLSFA